MRQTFFRLVSIILFAVLIGYGVVHVMSLWSMDPGAQGVLIAFAAVGCVLAVGFNLLAAKHVDPSDFGQTVLDNLFKHLPSLLTWSTQSTRNFLTFNGLVVAMLVVMIHNDVAWTSDIRIESNGFDKCYWHPLGARPPNMPASVYEMLQRKPLTKKCNENPYFSIWHPFQSRSFLRKNAKASFTCLKDGEEEPLETMEESDRQDLGGKCPKHADDSSEDDDANTAGGETPRADEDNDEPTENPTNDSEDTPSPDEEDNDTSAAHADEGGSQEPGLQHPSPQIVRDIKSRPTPEHSEDDLAVSSDVSPRREQPELIDFRNVSNDLRSKITKSIYESGTTEQLEENRVRLICREHNCPGGFRLKCVCDGTPTGAGKWSRQQLSADMSVIGKMKEFAANCPSTCETD